MHLKSFFPVKGLSLGNTAGYRRLIQAAWRAPGHSSAPGTSHESASGWVGPTAQAVLPLLSVWEGASLFPDLAAPRSHQSQELSHCGQPSEGKRKDHMFPGMFHFKDSAQKSMCVERLAFQPMHIDVHHGCQPVSLTFFLLPFLQNAA